MDEIVTEVKQSEEWENVKMNLLEYGMERGIEQGISGAVLSWYAGRCARVSRCRLLRRNWRGIIRWSRKFMILPRSLRLLMTAKRYFRSIVSGILEGARKILNKQIQYVKMRVQDYSGRCL